MKATSDEAKRFVEDFETETGKTAESYLIAMDLMGFKQALNKSKHLRDLFYAVPEIKAELEKRATRKEVSAPNPAEGLGALFDNI